MGHITVQGLGKAYRQYPGRWSRLAEWLLPGQHPRHTLKWVLQDISFTVAPGEAVGIIGINGAGKSTLLKMITGTTQPTTGSISMSGRVAALLELGMGFHADFSGRQNVVMAGQLLGYSLEEIEQLMPAIQAFAEIGDYIDQPVRVYSSGMQMRLAFSVATARRPDVLIVDEALSVGDAYFQHKSFERIREFGKQGTTLLIVSHDKQAIQSICNRAILLNAGRLAMTGDPESVMDYYNALIADQKQQQIIIQRKEDGSRSTVSGNKDAEFARITMHNEQGEDCAVFFVGAPAVVRVLVRVNRPVPNLVMGCGIKDRLGQMMFGTNTFHTRQIIEHPEAGSVHVISVSFAMNLGPGSYSLHISLHSNDNHIGSSYDWRDRECVFEVINTDKPVFVGSLWNPMQFTIESTHASAQ